MNLRSRGPTPMPQAGRNRNRRAYGPLSCAKDDRHCLIRLSNNDFANRPADNADTSEGPPAISSDGKLVQTNCKRT